MNPFLRPLRCVLAVSLLWLLAACGPARSPDNLTIPDATGLAAVLQASPQVATVLEPHDSMKATGYVGFSAVRVLDQFFGPRWRDPRYLIEFTATDGYVASIPSGKFLAYTATLAFARADAAPFVVNNPFENMVNVPLGPWYLVWDNANSSALQADGASDWPYQAVRIGLVNFPQSLLPGNMAATWSDQASLTLKHCLTCHQVNGYGGNKVVIDLVHEAQRVYSRADFLNWVLNPSLLKPGTEMPPLLWQLSQPERTAAANAIYDYLNALPQVP